MSECYLDKELCLISAGQWLRLFGDLRYRFVATSEFEADDCRVLTIWEGMDDEPREPPLIFETMVFGGPMNRESQRYATLQDALQGHAEMLERVRDACAEERRLQAR